MEESSLEVLARDIRLSQQEILRQVVVLHRDRIRELERQILELRKVLQYRLSHSARET